MTNSAEPDKWSYASLTAVQPGWPGTSGVEWVAATSESEQFRSRDLLSALDRLGGEGWELTAWMPEWADQYGGFYFKKPRR